MDNKNIGMDLYEALKSGLSADELENQFLTDLAAAKARYKKEEDEKKKAEKEAEEKRKAEEIALTRSIAADSLAEYFEAIFGAENCKGVTAETIEQDLKDLETNWKKTIDWAKNFNSGFLTNFDNYWDELNKILKTDLPKEKAKTKEEKPKNKITFDTKLKTDDDIIKEFLESLK